MSRSVRFRAAFSAVVVPIMVAMSAPLARAQAYLPPKGEGTVSILFQDTSVIYHNAPTIRLDVGHIRSESLLVDVTYGVTDNLAVSFGIPWLASKYTGATPHPLNLEPGAPPNPLEDGTYHSTFQDFRFDLRYNVTKRRIVLTPFVTTVTPSHDYETLAHTAPGVGLLELQIGVTAAKLLDSLVPGLFVQGRYSYGFVEKVIDISHNRSNMSLEVGYFATPKLRLLALGSAQVTHGGIDMPSPPLSPRAVLTPLEFLHHDQIQRINFLELGGGAAYSLTQSVDLFGSLLRTVAARNGHAIDRGLTVGMSWSFSTRSGKDRAIASSDRSLAKCMCVKSAS